MFNNLIKSSITLVLTLLVFIVLVIFLKQNDNIEQRLIVENQSLKKKLEKAELALAAGGNNSSAVTQGPFAKYALAFTDVYGLGKNVLEIDVHEWLPEDVEMGGTLKSYLTSDPKGLNFLTQNGADVSALQNYIHISLVERHHKDTTKYRPSLAYHMARSDDSLTYTFHLRDDIFWHKPTLDESDDQYSWLFSGKTCREGHFIDGRCRVTAHDLVFMMDMVMNPQVAGAASTRSYYESLDTYKALDDFTFQISFSKKKQTQDRTVRSLYPVPEFLYAYDQDGYRFEDSNLGTRFEAHWYDPNAIGAGPYRFVRFQTGELIELERDPKYPLGGNAFSKILFQIINEDFQRVRKMKKGEIDFTSLTPAQYRAEVLEAADDAPFKDGRFGSGEYWSHTY